MTTAGRTLVNGWTAPIKVCKACLPWIGEVQVADVPGRCEPGTGEMTYSGIARALFDMGYGGLRASKPLQKTRQNRHFKRLEAHSLVIMASGVTALNRNEPSTLP
ncbi:hydroxypyruvate isomerase [Agrobacterium tumefaciens 5A]|nr:hydroxypyruvate isomerase [Agrobacterium tumefaciens 5A]